MTSKNKLSVYKFVLTIDHRYEDNKETRLYPMPDDYKTSFVRFKLQDQFNEPVKRSK